jgi:hypothetical protein
MPLLILKAKNERTSWKYADPQHGHGKELKSHTQYLGPTAHGHGKQVDKLADSCALKHNAHRLIDGGKNGEEILLCSQGHIRYDHFRMNHEEQALRMVAMCIRGVSGKNERNDCRRNTRKGREPTW